MWSSTQPRPKPAIGFLVFRFPSYWVNSLNKNKYILIMSGYTPLCCAHFIYANGIYAHARIHTNTYIYIYTHILSIYIYIYTHVCKQKHTVYHCLCIHCMIKYLCQYMLLMWEKQSTGGWRTPQPITSTRGCWNLVVPYPYYAYLKYQSVGSVFNFGRFEVGNWFSSMQFKHEGLTWGFHPQKSKN